MWGGGEEKEEEEEEEKQTGAYESEGNMKFLAQTKLAITIRLAHGHNEIAMFGTNDIILCTHN